MLLSVGEGEEMEAEKWKHSGSWGNALWQLGPLTHAAWQSGALSPDKASGAPKEDEACQPSLFNKYCLCFRAGVLILGTEAVYELHVHVKLLVISLEDAWSVGFFQL